MAAECRSSRVEGTTLLEVGTTEADPDLKDDPTEANGTQGCLTALPRERVELSGSVECRPGGGAGHQQLEGGSAGLPRHQPGEGEASVGRIFRPRQPSLSEVT
eukprot:GFUD01136642.1.p2 GENE.GFUD01136642.1~~GFUD01136642.1.p2  ORF type:complete len:103 (-),score=28.69 GFUD01136642.1:685-993(-)